MPDTLPVDAICMTYYSKERIFNNHATVIFIDLSMPKRPAWRQDFLRRTELISFAAMPTSMVEFSEGERRARTEFE